MVAGTVVPLFTPTSTPLVRDTGRPEIVLFVGYPCLGKSTLYKRYFESTHTHVNQDSLGSRGKCVKAAEQSLLQGKSCVIGGVASSRIEMVDRR